MAKSPFAKQETQLYEYPAPLNAPKREETDSMPGETAAQYQARLDTIDPEEATEDHWLKLTIPRSRGMVDAVADATQSMLLLGENGGSPKFEQQIKRGNRAVFELLVKEWSFDAPITGDSYDRLAGWSGEWVSACLADAVRQGTQRDFAKKMSLSSPEPESLLDKPLEPQPVE